MTRRPSMRPRWCSSPPTVARRVSEGVCWLPRLRALKLRVLRPGGQRREGFFGVAFVFVTPKALNPKAQGREAHPGNGPGSCVRSCRDRINRIQRGDRTPTAYFDRRWPFPRVRSLRSRPWALGFNAFGVNAWKYAEENPSRRCSPGLTMRNFKTCASGYRWRAKMFTASLPFYAPPPSSDRPGAQVAPRRRYRRRSRTSSRDAFAGRAVPWRAGSGRPR